MVRVAAVVEPPPSMALLNMIRKKCPIVFVWMIPGMTHTGMTFTRILILCDSHHMKHLLIDTNVLQKQYFRGIIMHAFMFRSVHKKIYSPVLSFSLTVYFMQKFIMEN